MANDLDHAGAGRQATRHNGHVPPEADFEPPPPRPAGPSTRPALVALGIIFVLFVVGLVGAGLSGGPPSPTRLAPRPASPVPGTGGLVPAAARGLFAPVVTASEPPTDILAAVVVPRGTSAAPGSAVQRGVGLFDATVRTEVPAGEQQVITFFRTELAAGRWHVLQAGSQSGGGYQILAQHPGSDGYEWEIGVTLSPTLFSAAQATVSVPPGGLTPVTLRLFAVSDQQ